MSTRREQLLEYYRLEAGRRLLRAGDTLAARQSGPVSPGAVAMWEGEETDDFHGTLAAIWLWSRAQLITGEPRFGRQIGAAWAFVESAWSHFVPDSLSAAASDEAAYDCAMVLRAGLATAALTHSGDWRRYGERAARLLASYLGDLEDLNARGFADPGFLAWNLADFARAMADRGLLSAVARFVDRSFSTKQAPNFAHEPSEPDDLFDFSSTNATAMLALMATEGETPFVGSWLRERVAAHFPSGFLPRATDETAWNACVAAAAGRAFVLSHDERFLASHSQVLAELARRADAAGGAPGRGPGLPGDTLGAFYYGIALDAMVVGR